METSEKDATLFADGFDRVRDAAQFLGLSVSRVYRLMELGELPYAKFGKSRRIPHRALLNYAALHLISGPKE